ncbi:MAG: hypothetical protein EXS47_01455 [Candidatus Zambryskibacteria bacterium]|nr:hypothetical protein [Candidatus Zambryskibacteria bacterium]
MSFSTNGMDFDKSSIERLKRTLYSRDEDVVPKEKRTPVAPHESDAPTSWGTAPSYELPPEVMSKKNNSFFNKFLLGSLGFFFVSLVVALFIFFGGFNMISSNNLDIKIVAPSMVSSGEELSIELLIVNANSSDIEEVGLFVDYPAGAEAVPDSKMLSREKIDLGTIEKGEVQDYSVRTVLFGEKDSLKVFTFRLEYKVKGSSAVFSKEKRFEVLIGSSPILLNLTYPKEVNSGQQLTIALDITSNSSVPVKKLLVKVEYPYGFTYKDSNIKPVRDNSIWNVGDLKDGDKKTLIITGSILGQNLEDRSFKFSAGTESLSNPKDFDTTLVADLITIGIRKSFFDLTVLTGGNSSVVGETIPVTVKWTNTLTDKILDARIETKVTGNIFDRDRVSVGENGFYRSVDNTIVWDKNSTSPLTSIFPGDSGSVSFSIASLSNPSQIRSIKNPYINLRVTMTGQRSGRDVETVSSEADILIKINSELGLTAKSYRSIGPFNNTGSVPPRADKESTYTVTWTLTNSTNNLRNAVVYSTLPAGIIWKAETSLVGEKISFNPDTRVVTWGVPNITAGAGFALSPKTVSFKVGIIPSINQIGTAPFLTSEVYSEAMDTYTENLLKITAPSVTTKFSDPSFVTGNDSVTR